MSSDIKFSQSSDDNSDEEISFRPRKGSHRQTVGCIQTSPEADDENNRSFRLIRTQSLPNISLKSMSSLLKRRTSSIIGLAYEPIDREIYGSDATDDINDYTQLKNIQYNKVENLDSRENKMNATPNKDDKIAQLNIFTTPSSDMKSTTFKMPGKSVSHKPPVVTSARSTAKKQFKHIISPVAFYIYNCPQATLMTNVYPTKSSPSLSRMPRLETKSTPGPSKCGKENVNLPPVAYKPAKETKVITHPEENKLPNSEWAKRVASSIPKAVVLQHTHRQINSHKKPLRRQEDSFVDLPLHQADISLCTQTSASLKTKKR